MPANNIDNRDQDTRIRLPIGYDDFGKIHATDLTFVDKSLFIREVLEEIETEVSVITRPRRFGKTLNLSMLRYFLAAEVMGQPTSGMFDQLKIAQCGEKIMQHQGKYPVIFITFKDIKENSLSAAYNKFHELIVKTFDHFNYLENSDKLSKTQKALLQIILSREANQAQLENSLQTLTEYLAIHHGVKPWLLIDEYDSPIHAAYAHGYYDKMVELMRGIFGAALKNNNYLKKAVVTGILRISKESLFSGLNNLKVYSILQTRYSEYFGFTDTEVRELLEAGNLMEKYVEISEWYNGYRFGDTTIYNPWSIANYLSENFEARPYWVNTSDNQLIKDILKKSRLDFKQSFEILFAGGSVKKVIDSNMVFKYLEKDLTGAWSLLLMSGYLKPITSEITDQGDLCELAIPNLEVQTLYRQIIEQWLANGQGINWYNDFLENLLAGDIEKFKIDLEKVLLQIVSYHDPAKEPEAFYHGLLLGFTVSLYGTYEIQSNREGGLGRFDIMLIPKDSQKLGILMELKIKAVNETLESSAKKALQQIEDQRYEQSFNQKSIKQIMKIGIGFEGKAFRLEYNLTSS